MVVGAYVSLVGAYVSLVGAYVSLVGAYVDRVDGWVRGVVRGKEREREVFSSSVLTQY